MPLMKTYLLLWGIMICIMCYTGTANAGDDDSAGGTIVLEEKQNDTGSDEFTPDTGSGAVHEPQNDSLAVESDNGMVRDKSEPVPLQVNKPPVTDELDSIDDLDGMDDLDREIYGIDDLDQDDGLLPGVQAKDDLSELDALVDKQYAVPAANGEINNEVLLDPADTEQMRQLQIDISIHPADVIMLRSGETVEGVLRKATDDVVSIENETGLHIYNRSDIEFIDEISEKERFYLLDKIQALQAYNKKAVKKELEASKQQLEEKQRTAEAKTEAIERITGKDETSLYNLTHLRLEEIVKEFSQFSPDHWRYYHRKNDAQKAILQLNRLRRYAHANIVELIDQYVRAFDIKIKELNEPAGSRLTESYRDNYKKLFSLAEQRRNILKGADFH